MGRRDDLERQLNLLASWGMLKDWQPPATHGDKKWCVTSVGISGHSHMTTPAAEAFCAGAVEATLSAIKVLGLRKLMDRVQALQLAGGASGDSATRRLAYAAEETAEVAHRIGWVQ